jgi:hypothetical protein
MSTAQEVFERHFPGLTPAEVDAELSAVPPLGATPVSATALRYLTDHGGDEAVEALAAFDAEAVQQDRTLAAAQALQELLATSLTIEEAAVRLGVSRSRVSHRMSDKSLYAVSVQSRRYLPSWQFEDTGGAITGLAQVVPAIPSGLHPLTVEAFMTTPLDDLDGDSPLDYLRSGADPEAVVEFLTALGHR